MKNLLLAVAFIFAVSTVAVAQEGAAPAPGVDQAPAGDAHKDAKPAKKDKKMKKGHKAK